ncbi:hypothetical protein [Spiroplasma endosymbiont of Phyllotreta cruciferae]|uniref:hypothetical protein n=1 Tax=Spiroplasma endosymbiont of Phyllotreta cruciferae TaxID=2886375 RepID=UPI00209DCDE1|nr:hypothetical protein [Spiroplasma endosymbiont of Phyllotreta cruciferae]
MEKSKDDEEKNKNLKKEYQEEVRHYYLNANHFFILTFNLLNNIAAVVTAHAPSATNFTIFK